MRLQIAFLAFGLPLRALPAGAVTPSIEASTAKPTDEIRLRARGRGVAAEVRSLNGEAVDPPAVAGKDFHIALPPALFASNPGEIMLEWVDYWR